MRRPLHDGQMPRAVGIFDLIHVFERLWQVAHVFHREGSREAGQFVSRRRVVSAAIGNYEDFLERCCGV